jgi:hypothetical protein
MTQGWETYEAIKKMMEKHGMLNLEHKKYNAVIRELLEILQL